VRSEKNGKCAGRQASASFPTGRTARAFSIFRAVLSIPPADLFRQAQCGKSAPARKKEKAEKS
jgi:hypothetical protein